MEEQKEVQVTEQAPQEQSPQVDKREQNFAIMRKKIEAEEAARKAAENRAQELERILQQQQVGRQATVENHMGPEEDDIQVDNDDYLQAKHYKAGNKKTKVRLSEQDQKIKELNEKIALLEAKTEIDAIKDFKEVVNDENLATFARLYPEDYEVVMSNPHLSKKSKAAYNMIKNYGISNPLLKDAEDRVASNQRKPQSSSVSAPQVATTPLSNFNDEGRRVLSEADRDRINREIERKRALR